MLHRGVMIALLVWVPSTQGAAQEPWPGARCYTITLGPWTRTDSRPGADGRPDAPELIILDSARLGVPLGLGDPPDTVRRVVHGRFRPPRPTTPEYVDYQSDRWFSGWTRPRPDSLTVRFGTGSSLTSFEFRDDGDRLAGTVSWWVDYGASATARATGRPVRCPPGPPQLGRLRLATVETWAPRLYAEPPMPGVELELTTEEPVPCGTHIDYTLIMRDTLVAWTVHGLYRRSEPCTGDRRPAQTLGPGALRPRRYTVLVGVRGDTNRFALTVTDAVAKLTPEGAPSVTADDRLRPRPRHNLLIVRCWYGSAPALCDEVDRWLADLRGMSRFGTLPYWHEVNEGVRAARFRYDSAATLARVRACVASIATEVRETTGVHVWIRTWLGEEMMAASERREAPYASVPTGVTARGACAG